MRKSLLQEHVTTGRGGDRRPAQPPDKRADGMSEPGGRQERNRAVLAQDVKGHPARAFPLHNTLIPLRKPYASRRLMADTGDYKLLDFYF